MFGKAFKKRCESSCMQGTEARMRTSSSIVAVARTKAGLGQLPYLEKANATLIRMVGLATALHGCEAAPCSESADRSVQSLVFKAIGPRANRSSNAMIFANAAD